MTGSRPDALARHIGWRVQRTRPLRFDEFVEEALYHPLYGFYASGGRAGRRGDFITSPEVGPLFAAVLARAIDAWWTELGCPGEFTVVDAGAGPGTLAAGILGARPQCLEAMQMVLVERSARQRSVQRSLIARTPHRRRVEVRDSLPARACTGVLLANELLDNLAVRLLEATADGWSEVYVDVDPSGALVEVLIAAPDDATTMARRLVPDATPGARLPLQDNARRWLTGALTAVTGRVVVIDYATDSANLAARPVGEWLRTYSAHRRAGDVLSEPGSCDITCEVAVDQLALVREPDMDRSQADALQSWGIDELVDEGRRVWAERAHVGDLAAVTARSRVGESQALTDRAGLGAFRVLEWAT